MGLPYPGGPEIDKLAREGNPAAIDFPRALAREGNYEFSFSGLKSAVLNYINSEKMKGHELHKADIAASFQAAVVEVLVHKAFEAIHEAGRGILVVAGGVAANKASSRDGSGAGNSLLVPIAAPLYGQRWNDCLPRCLSGYGGAIQRSLSECCSGTGFCVILLIVRWNVNCCMRPLVQQFFVAETGQKCDIMRSEHRLILLAALFRIRHDRSGIFSLGGVR